MIEGGGAEVRETWSELLPTGFLHGLREAHTEATLVVTGALDRASGFKERSFGFTAFDVLESQLDRVFGVGAAEEPPELSGPFAGNVVRDDLNGSPGWRLGRHRVLLKRHEFGAVRAIRWDRESPTKQAVARQEFSGDPQLALDLGLTDTDDTPGVVTLVLAHSATDEPLEMELFLGLPRLNADGGEAWHWLQPLNDDTLGPDPRRRLVEPTLPLWNDTDADVPVTLHRRSANTANTSKTANAANTSKTANTIVETAQ
ncbi:hypothetical protein ACGFNU_03405 [Spirillospora sp. NPDC048911]|uniref:hypothetical protein n=1 Tax=Spirillospora sp. NPDC048911 TaxID=3364527 RepID=UPI0037241541